MRKSLAIYFSSLLLLSWTRLSAQLVQAPSYSQKQNYEWAFGGSGFNFNNDTLIVLHTTVTVNGTNNSGFGSGAGYASVCDTTGKLLFYTDGYGIYYGSPPVNNSSNFYMPNAYPTIDYTANISPVGPPVGTIYPILHWPAADGSVIVPMIDSPEKYYVFTNERTLHIYNDTWGFANYGASALYYSVVDMSLNNGYGDVEPGRKAILIDSNLACPIEAIVGDDCNIWLLVHDLYNTYKTYEITSSGISSTPVISMGANIVGVDQNYFYCAVTSSPNRLKLASAGYGGDFAMEISDFDPATGVVSNSVLQYNPTTGPTGSPTDGGVMLAFSPDNTKLYGVTGTPWSWGYDTTIPVTILQYDISNGPGPWTPVIVDTSIKQQMNMNDYARLGPDGKIYINSTIVIDSPNASGIACHVHALPANLISTFNGSVQNALNGGDPLNSWAVYPSNPVPVLPNHDTIVTRQQLFICFADTAVTITASDTAGWNYTWGDYNKFRLRVYHRQVDSDGAFALTYNTPGCQYHIDSFIVQYIAPYTVNLGSDTVFCNSSSFSDLLSPHDTVPGGTYLWQDGSKDSTYSATGTGTYWVTVTDTAGCKVSDTMHIEGTNLTVNLGNDTTLCIDKPIQFGLQVDSVAGASYLWSTGSTATTISIEDTGTYWIAVIDTPCAAGDTIDIHGAYCECAFGMPNAFTPNGDGKDDVFQPVLPPGCPVAGYLLTIYNRWGQMIFTSTNVAQGWDGTFNGIPADIDTYRYVVRFEAGTDHEQRYQKGDLTLIR